MADDKYTATWVSYSSIEDYFKCPRSYFLKNVYRDPQTHHRIALVNPALTLGLTVHAALDELYKLPSSERFSVPLSTYFESKWREVQGKRGGFYSPEEEEEYKQRGIRMLKRVEQNADCLKSKAIKIRPNAVSALMPAFFLSEEENLILCGKVDWLEYIPETDSVHIIDFKTGKNKENSNSLQLPIYQLLIERCQSKKISKASYWYLETHNTPQEVPLSKSEEAFQSILNIARDIKNIRIHNYFSCPHNGCFACQALEMILNKEAEFVDTIEGKDVYILPEGYRGKKEDDIPF